MFKDFEHRTIKMLNDMKENDRVIIGDLSDEFRDLADEIIINRIKRTEDDFEIKIPAENIFINYSGFSCRLQVVLYDM